MDSIKKLFSVFGKIIFILILITLTATTLKNFPRLWKKTVSTYQQGKIVSKEAHTLQDDIQNSHRINQEYSLTQDQYHQASHNIPKRQDFQSFLESFLQQIKKQGLVTHSVNIQKSLPNSNSEKVAVELMLSGSYDQFLALLNFISANHYFIFTHHWTLTRTRAPATTVLSNDENKNNVPDQLNIDVIFQFEVLN